MFNNNKTDSSDINLKLIQRFYIRYLFKNKYVVDKFAAIDTLKEKFWNIKLKLTFNDHKYEFLKEQPDIKDKTIFNLIKYLAKEVNNFILKKYDISYDINLYIKEEKRTKKITREEEIILFGTKTMLDTFKHKANIQYFIDITYWIFPQRYKPYRLLIIKSFNIEEYKTILNAMLVKNYEGEKSLFYIFKYFIDFML